MAALVKVTPNGQITIPVAVRQKLEIQEGDYVEVSVVDDTIVLTPKQLLDKSQAYFWTEEWQAAEREADEDIRGFYLVFYLTVYFLISFANRTTALTP